MVRELPAGAEANAGRVRHMDETLDLVVSADFSNWTRRDEDEMELAVSMGVQQSHDAQRILSACAQVEESLTRGEVPWDRSWQIWTPTAYA